MQKLKSFILILLALIIALFGISGCSSEPEVFEEELYALNTIISLTIYSENQTALIKAKEEINRLEALLSVTAEGSDISRINATPGVFVKVSEDTFKLIKTSIDVSDNTRGVFDITVYPAVMIWGFTTSGYKVPTQNEIEKIKPSVNYKKIILDESTRSVKIPSGTSLDLGGIAKGYIADKAAEVLISQGVTSALLNFGGNIRLIGTKPDGKDFKIGIKAPFSEGYFGILKAQNVTVSTAGGYERYFEENGKIYHHIINPFTASPAESDILSSTVVGKSGEICDSLATSAFIMGSNKLSELSQAFPDYGFIALTDEVVYISYSLAEDFELSENYKNYEITII